MIDWKTRAAALDPAVPQALLDQIIPTLEALEGAFRPLVDALSADELSWGGPEAA